MISLLCPTCNGQTRQANAEISIGIKTFACITISRKGIASLGLRQPVIMTYQQAADRKPRLGKLTCPACNTCANADAWRMVVSCDNCKEAIVTVEVSDSYDTTRWLCREASMLFCDSCWEKTYKKSYCQVCAHLAECKERRKE